MSIRGLSRLLMFFIAVVFDIRNLARKCLRINIVNGLQRVVAEGYQKRIRTPKTAQASSKPLVFGVPKDAQQSIADILRGVIRR